jgi:hypothetical protein
MPRSSDKETPSVVPSDAMMALLAPDGYYTYLDVPKRTAGVADSTTTSPAWTTTTTTPDTTTDADRIKKKYRKLSLQHHPDRTGGNADTFRLLNRAQKVLMDPKLRQQYDILGIDLDDDDQEVVGTTKNNNDNNRSSNGDTDGGGGAGSTSSSDSSTVVQEIASQVLASLIQLGVRTGVCVCVCVCVLLPNEPLDPKRNARICLTVMFGVWLCFCSGGEYSRITTLRAHACTHVCLDTHTRTQHKQS